MSNRLESKGDKAAQISRMIHDARLSPADLGFLLMRIGIEIERIAAKSEAATSKENHSAE